MQYLTVALAKGRLAELAMDLFIENEQQRSFLMDRFAEVVIYCGEKWFDER